MREVICDQCSRSLGVIVADGVNLRTLRGFERGHDQVCTVWPKVQIAGWSVSTSA